MEELVISQNGGWIMALVLGLIGLIKTIHEAYSKRQENKDQDTKEDKKTAQEILKAQVQSLTAKVEALEKQVTALVEQRQTLSTSQAALKVQLDAALADVARLRKGRNHYKALAKKAQSALRRAGLAESDTLGEEISVADEASSVS